MVPAVDEAVDDARPHFRLKAPALAASSSPQCPEHDEARTLSPECSIHIDFNPEPGVDDEATPVMGPLGAPRCRCTTAVLSLLAMMSGLVLAVSGASTVLFFVETEALVIIPGVTLLGIGVVLMLIGCVSWVSKFMLHDCLARVFAHMKEAPVLEAQRRRAKRLSRMSGTMSRSSAQLNRTASQATIFSQLSAQASKY